MFRFTIRDVLWLTVVVAVALTLWLGWSREMATLRDESAAREAKLRDEVATERAKAEQQMRELMMKSKKQQEILDRRSRLQKASPAEN